MAPGHLLAIGGGDDVWIGDTTTGPNGFYLFDSLSPGMYYIQVILPGGYGFTMQHQGPDPAADSDVEPSAALSPAFNLPPGYYNPDLDAGLQRIISTILMF